MYREIKVGDSTIPMLANGATPIRYRMVFGKDIISEFQRAGNDAGIVSESISELAFIMNKAAEAQNEGKPMTNLNEDSFIEWLEQFGTLDVTMAAEEIIDLFMNNEKTTSEVKKKAKGQVKEN